MNHMKERCCEILTSDANLHDLCNLVSQYSGNPIAITLVTRTIIAKSDNYTSDLVNEYTLSQNLASAEEIKESEEKLTQLLAMKRAVTKIWPYHTHKRINLGCFYNSTMFAVIDCPVTNPSRLEESIKAIEQAAPMFVTALRLNSYIMPVTTDPVQTYLVGLLKGDILEDHQQRFLDFFQNKISSWKILWISPKTTPDNFSDSHLIDKFCSSHPNIWNAHYENGYVVLMDAAHSEIIHNFYELCSEHYWMSVSETFEEIKDLIRHLSLARSALRLAQHVKMAEEIIFVKKYKKIILFLDSAQEHKIKTLESPLICEIKRYDKEHESDYFITLQAYLLNQQNYNKVAKKMHVHKNTIIYRLQRMSELFELDLKDCGTITDLYLSLFLDLL